MAIEIPLFMYITFPVSWECATKLVWLVLSWAYLLKPCNCCAGLLVDMPPLGLRISVLPARHRACKARLAADIHVLQLYLVLMLPVHDCFCTHAHLVLLLPAALHRMISRSGTPSTRSTTSGSRRRPSGSWGETTSRCHKKITDGLPSHMISHATSLSCGTLAWAKCD